MFASAKLAHFFYSAKFNGRFLLVFCCFCPILSFCVLSMIWKFPGLLMVAGIVARLVRLGKFLMRNNCFCARLIRIFALKGARG